MKALLAAESAALVFLVTGAVTAQTTDAGPRGYGASPPVAYPPPPPPEPPPPSRSLSLTFSPLHLLLPVVEATAELRVVDHFSLAAIGGYGSVQLEYYDSNFLLQKRAIPVAEVGGQIGFYPLDAFKSLELGLEVLWVKVSASDLQGGTVSASANGIAIGPMIGYKLITRGGFTFVAQGGVEHVSARAEASQDSSAARSTANEQDWIPLLNLNIGWSF